MDCDGQHDAAEIADLLAQIPPYDLVVGCRTKEYESTWHRKAANRFYNRFASWLSSSEIPDLTSGFRAMRREVVMHFLPLFPAGFSASATGTLAFLKGGYNVAFVPVHVNSRRGGKSKINLWKDGRQFLMLILRMVMLVDPQRIFSPVSAFLILLGLLAWGLGIWHEGRLVFPNSTIFLFTTSITTWLMGLLASQLASARIHNFGDETVIEEEPGEPGANG
jgi:glycosyltransferase involved in cell wall biosynthesis